MGKMIRHSIISQIQKTVMLQEEIAKPGILVHIPFLPFSARQPWDVPEVVHSSSALTVPQVDSAIGIEGNLKGLW